MAVKPKPFERLTCPLWFEVIIIFPFVWCEKNYIFLSIFVDFKYKKVKFQKSSFGCTLEQKTIWLLKIVKMLPKYKIPNC